MSEQNNPQIEPQLDENQIIALRREKLHNIRKERNAYPNDSNATALPPTCIPNTVKSAKKNSTRKAFPSKLPAA